MKNLIILLLVIGGFFYFTSDSFDFSGIEKSINNFLGNNEKNPYSSDKLVSARQLPGDARLAAKIRYEWAEMLNSNKKVIFYTYTNDVQSQNFHRGIQNQLSKLGSSYKLVAYEHSYYKGIMYGEIKSKSCSSPAECNQMRKESSAISNLTILLDNCAKTMCIINNKNNSYLRLRKKDLNDANATLTKYRNW